LDVDLELEFDVEKVGKGDPGLWRYAEFFPYLKKKDVVSLGEGWTPLVKLSDSVFLKLEGSNPTGSFKDRGSTVLISALCDLVKVANGFICEDSSGNAGASIAAYAARAGLRAKIFVPETVAGPKFDQIRFYGADVVKVSGSRSKVAEEAQKPVEGGFYVGHIFHPLFRDGIRTLAYEIAEQFGWQGPERVYLPASAGTLLLGVLSGFEHLVDSGVIDAVPKVVACQTRQVSPLYHKFKNLTYVVPDKVTSIADALVSVNPPLLDLMTQRLKEAEGDVIMVEENEIHDAFMELARKGFFVEPSSAVAYAGFKKQNKNREAPKATKTVIVLTGSGLKTVLKPI
jgi:threonine synthase